MKKYKIIIAVIIIIILSAVVFQKYYTESKWKTYVNEEYSFSVQYPEEYVPEYSSANADLWFHKNKNVDETPIRILIGTTQPDSKDKINRPYTDEFNVDKERNSVNSMVYRQKNVFNFLCEGIDIKICERVIKSAKYETKN